MNGRGIAGLLPLIFTAAVASAQSLPIQGTDGGGEFRQQCREREYLVGFYAGVGEGVHAISITCARQALNPFGRTLEGPSLRGILAGGTGGTEFPDIRCVAHDEAVSGLSFGLVRGGDAPDLISDLEFTCSTFEPPHHPRGRRRVVVFDGSAHAAERQLTRLPEQRCPVGTLAIGIRGRAGEHVNALGLICGVGPAVPGAAAEAARTKVPQTGGAASKDRVGGRVSQPRTRPDKPSGKATAPGDAGSAAAAPTDVPPASPIATYDNPTNPAGERLNVCLELPNRGCGDPAAEQFCRAKGHGVMIGYASELLKAISATWSGQACRQANCAVFTSITCGS